MEEKADIGNAKYYITKSYGNWDSLIEHKTVEWYKQENFHITILTTEMLPIDIIPDADVYDFAHNIYEPNLHFIGVEGLNTTTSKDKSKVLEGKDRILFVKQNIMDLLNVKDDMIISNGIKQKWNFVNCKGTNKFKDSLQDVKTGENLAIILTYPHPDQINEKKGYFIKTLEHVAKRDGVSIYEYLNSQECEELMISAIINDDLNQALGRVLGYRNDGKISNVYVIFNNSLMSYIQPKYISSKIFTYTGLYQLKDSQIKNNNIWEFLTKCQLLHAKGKRLTITEDTKIACKNQSLITMSWIRYIIKKVRFLSNLLLKTIKKKILSVKKIWKVHCRFAYYLQYLLRNNSQTERLSPQHTKYCLERHGILKYIKELNKTKCLLPIY
jgi:hypothetical protein